MARSATSLRAISRVGGKFSRRRPDLAQESDPEIAEAIQHSRLEEGAHNTNELEITRQHTAPTNRPLTQAEKREASLHAGLRRATRERMTDA